MRRKTVFVVGAGASNEFGLPLGAGLAEHIRGALDAEFGATSSQSGPISESLGLLGYNNDDIIAARELRGTLLASRSIDHALFKLRDRPAVIRVGKIAIAERLLSGEASCGLPANLAAAEPHTIHAGLFRCRETWIARLFAALVGDRAPEDIPGAFENVGFVIFNYDRLVEQYLLMALVDIGLQRREDVVGILRKIPIVHVYGQLGALPTPGTQSVASFGSTSHQAPGRAANGIKTYTEGADDEVTRNARALISEAERVVFLGFGFDPINVKVLYPAGAPEGQILWGTRYGLQNHDALWRGFVEATAGERFSDIPGFEACKCNSFIDSRAGPLMEA